MENQDEELEDILRGLEQRISVYERKRKDLQKKREQLGEEIATVEKYLELAKTLYRVEADNNFGRTNPFGMLISFSTTGTTSNIFDALNCRKHFFQSYAVSCGSFQAGIGRKYEVDLSNTFVKGWQKL